MPYVYRRIDADEPETEEWRYYYINDIVGLAQVLVDGDGTTEVYNLWGLRLLSQSEGKGLMSLDLRLMVNGVKPDPTFLTIGWGPPLSW